MADNTKPTREHFPTRRTAYIRQEELEGYGIKVKMVFDNELNLFVLTYREKK